MSTKRNSSGDSTAKHAQSMRRHHTTQVRLLELPIELVTMIVADEGLGPADYVSVARVLERCTYDERLCQLAARLSVIAVCPELRSMNENEWPDGTWEQASQLRERLLLNHCPCLSELMPISRLPQNAKLNYMRAMHSDHLGCLLRHPPSAAVMTAAVDFVETLAVCAVHRRSLAMLEWVFHTCARSFASPEMRVVSLASIHAAIRAQTLPCLRFLLQRIPLGFSFDNYYASLFNVALEMMHERAQQANPPSSATQPIYMFFTPLSKSCLVRDAMMGVPQTPPTSPHAILEYLLKQMPVLHVSHIEHVYSLICTHQRQFRAAVAFYPDLFAELTSCLGRRHYSHMLEIAYSLSLQHVQAAERCLTGVSLQRKTRLTCVVDLARVINMLSESDWLAPNHVLSILSYAKGVSSRTGEQPCRYVFMLASGLQQIVPPAAPDYSALCAIISKGTAYFLQIAFTKATNASPR